MNGEGLSAARRWARAWEAAWPAGDNDAIAALYAAGATYRSHPFRPPEPGGAAAYTARVFAEETGVRCRFGEPVETADRAVVEWWATFVEEGAAVTLAGATALHFDAAGLVTEHVDYWVQHDGAVEPYPTWGR